MLCSSLLLPFSSTLSSLGQPTVPELAESLQQISGQLNTVLSALDSLAQRQSTTPFTAFSPPHSNPASAAPATSQLHTPGSSSFAPPLSVGLSDPPWSWPPQNSSTATPLFSTPISSGLRATEDLMNSRWSQIFPSMNRLLICIRWHHCWC